MKQDIEIKNLFNTLSKKKKMIISITLFFTIVIGILTYFIPPSYEAKIDLLINNSPTTSQLGMPSMNEIDTNLRLIETYKVILESDLILNKVQGKLERTYTIPELENRMEIRSGAGSQVIRIVAQAGTSVEAAQLVNTYAEIFQEEMRNLMGLNNITILKGVKAGIDTRKIQSSYIFYILITAALSLVLSSTYYILKEGFSPLLNTVERIENVLKVPVIGSVLRGSPKLNFMQKSFKRCDEVDFCKFASHIHFLMENVKVQSILITSADSGDGKTFIGGNLAVKLARDGKKVLFIDFDLRKSDGALFFGLPGRKGITSVISENNTPPEVIQQTNVKRLSFLGTGPIPPDNPMPFILSNKLDKLLSDCKTSFDIIIIDAPSLTHADSLNLFRLVDGCLYVINAEYSTEVNTLKNLQLVNQFKANILGVVLNRIHKRSSNYTDLV